MRHHGDPTLKLPRNPLSPLGWIVVATILAAVIAYGIWAIWIAEPLYPLLN